MIANENPIPHKYALAIIGRRYDQIIQPWEFGHGETKATCLWLKNLPPLLGTYIHTGREQRIWLMPPGENRQRDRDRGLAFPEIGQVRKGAKKDPQANKPGADLKYFRVEFDEAESKTAAAFREIYKEQYEKIGGPQFIRIIFPFDEISRVWDAWLEAYTAGRLVARSDGEFIQYQLDSQGEIIVRNGLNDAGEKVPHPADNIAGYDYQNKPVKFKHSGRLKVIVPELARAAYLTVMTSSVHDIGNISDQLAAFAALNNGRLAGIPFILRRRLRKISTPSENGQRVRRAKSLISIEADPDWVRAKLTQVKALAMPDVKGLLLNGHEEIDAEEVDSYDEDEQADFENAPEDAPTEDVQLFDPYGEWAVKYAAEIWNIPSKDALEALQKKIPDRKPMDKRDIIEIVIGVPA